MPDQFETVAVTCDQPHGNLVYENSHGGLFAIHTGCTR
jgi:hypothetical protein